MNDEITNEIFESGFIQAFIEEYFEYYNYSVYSEKDKLDFNLCKNDKQKNKIIKSKIKDTKKKIQSLGNYELSSAYLISCRKESDVNFIEYNERHKFWLSRFVQKCEDSISVFFPVEYLFTEYFKENQSSNIDDFQEYFLDVFPKYFDANEFVIGDIVIQEAELKENILFLIKEFKENKYWTFDFNDFEKYIPYNNSIKLLFELSELFLHLQRYSSFNVINGINKVSVQTALKKNPEKKVDFIDEIQELSNIVRALSLEEITVENLVEVKCKYFSNNDAVIRSNKFQNALIKANEKNINIILENFDYAISNNCENLFDFDSLEIPENYNINYKYNPEEESFSQRVMMESFVPDNEDLIKKILIKEILIEIEKLDFTVRKITRNPERDNKYKVFNILNEFEAFNLSYEFLMEELKVHLKNNAFDDVEILIDSINTFFSKFELLSSRLPMNIGYRSKESKQLEQAISNYKIHIFNQTISLIEIVDINQRENFKSELISIIRFYKAKKEISNEPISNIIIQILDYFIDFKEISNVKDTKEVILKNQLIKYGFLEIDKLKELSEENVNKLFNNLYNNKLPYQIAMLDFLGFFNHLQNNYFINKIDMHKKVSEWFGKDKNGRTIRGNINSLTEHSEENKGRYTAHIHKQSVADFYDNLK